jgi:hypothetical protein
MKSLKTYLPVLIALAIMLIQLPGLSQSSDTSKVTLPKKDALKVLAKGYEAKALEQQRDLLMMANDTLKARISIKDMQVINLKGEISDYKNIIISKDEIIKVQTEQRKVFETNVAALQKEIKRQTRAKRVTAIVGILTTGIMTYLLIVK